MPKAAGKEGRDLVQRGGEQARDGSGRPERARLPCGGWGRGGKSEQRGSSPFKHSKFAGPDSVRVRTLWVILENYSPHQVLLDADIDHFGHPEAGPALKASARKKKEPLYSTTMPIVVL